MLLDYMFFFSGLHRDLFSPFFLIQIIEITRTLTLLLILLHLNGTAAMRLEVFTLLLGPEILPRERCKVQNVCVSSFCSGFFIDDCKRYAGHDKMTQ